MKVGIWQSMQAQSTEALKAWRPTAEARTCASVAAVFQTVVAGETDCGLVPIESMEQGTQALTLDSLLQHSDQLKICGATLLASVDDKLRFIAVGREAAAPTGRDVTTLAVYPRRDRVGILSALTRIISSVYGLNMNAIQSRPDGRGGFVFFIDIEGHLSDERVAECLTALRAGLADTEVRVLGSYPWLPFKTPLIRTIAIIGGSGEMGRFLVPFFEGLGYEVLVAGRRTALSYAEAVKQAEAVIVNVPIEHAESVIREVGPLMTADQLLIDNTGVKSQVIETMLASTAAEVLSIHTMFGPHVRDLKGENIIVIHTARSGQMAEEFENVLHKHGATLTVTTAAEHDRLATLTQGLEHVISAARMAVIQELAGGPEALTPFSTPNSRLSMLVDGRIHGGSAELYATMLAQNRAALTTLKAFGAQIDAIISGLECGDSSRLAELLKANRARLADEFVERGTVLTGALQDRLRD